MIQEKEEKFPKFGNGSLGVQFLQQERVHIFSHLLNKKNKNKKIQETIMEMQCWGKWT